MGCLAHLDSAFTFLNVEETPGRLVAASYEAPLVLCKVEAVDLVLEVRVSTESYLLLNFYKFNLS
jgi:hypothetical protein